LRSLSSVYELLPLFPCLEHGDRLVKITSSNIIVPHLDRDRMDAAIAFHDSIRTPAESRDAKGDIAPYEQVVFYNRRQRTPLCGTIDGSSNLRLFDHDLS
jgi:hypothetical protein